MQRIVKGVQGVGLREEDAKMFAVMITHKDFEDIMQNSNKLSTKERLGTYTKEEQLKAKHRAEVYRQEISRCLSKMDQSLHMVFKVNNYLRAIDIKLGSPINHFYYTVS